MNRAVHLWTRIYYVVAFENNEHRINVPPL